MIINFIHRRTSFLIIKNNLLWSYDLNFKIRFGFPPIEYRRDFIVLPNLIVSIIADKDCTMDNILFALKECKRADIRRIFFMTNRIR